MVKVSKLSVEHAKIIREGYLRLYRVRKNIMDKARDEIPHGWLDMNYILPAEDHKEKVSIYFEKSVLKYFKASGVNWQERVRFILREYMTLQLQKILDERSVVDQQLEKYGEELDLPNPYD